MNLEDEFLKFPSIIESVISIFKEKMRLKQDIFDICNYQNNQNVEVYEVSNEVCLKNLYFIKIQKLLICKILR